MSNITPIASIKAAAPAEKITYERVNELLQRRNNRAVVLELPTDSIAMTDLLGFAASINHRVTYRNGRFVLRPIKPAAQPKPAANIIKRGWQYLTTPQAEF